MLGGAEAVSLVCLCPVLHEIWGLFQQVCQLWGPFSSPCDIPEA